MKVKDISVTHGAVIPIAPFENMRVSYAMTIELEPKDDVKEIFERGRHYLHSVVDEEVQRCKLDYLKLAYEDKFRWYNIGGKDYISVTTVLYWDTEWRVTQDHLSQLAARGTIVGAMMEHFLVTGVWINPEEIGELDSDVATLLGGSSHLHWNDCSHVAFCEKFKKDIEVKAVQQTVFNPEVGYAGTYDIVGTYQGKQALMDVKCGGYNMAQLAAYAVCVPGIELLVVLPVGPTDNKCGYMKPVVTDDIKGHFEKFLFAREKFRKRFGI